jgi:hypothetical protein
MGGSLGSCLSGSELSSSEVLEGLVCLTLEGVELALLLGNFMSSGSSHGSSLGFNGLLFSSLEKFSSVGSSLLGFAHSHFEVFLGFVGLTLDFFSI